MERSMHHNNRFTILFSLLLEAKIKNLTINCTALQQPIRIYILIQYVVTASD